MALAIAGLGLFLYIVALNPYIVSGLSLFLSLVTCVFMLINHKSYRVIAFLTWVALIFSINKDFRQNGNAESSGLIFTAGLLVALGLAYYSRHPFMNRRQRWFAAESLRHDIEIDAYLYPGNHSVMTKDLSTLGAKVQFPKDVPEHFKAGTAVGLRVPLCPMEEIKARIIAIDGNVARLHFDKLSMTDEQIMELWIKSLLKIKATE